jgi:hypothetical protein
MQTLGHAQGQKMSEKVSTVILQGAFFCSYMAKGIEYGIGLAKHVYRDARVHCSLGACGRLVNTHALIGLEQPWETGVAEH